MIFQRLYSGFRPLTAPRSGNRPPADAKSAPRSADRPIFCDDGRAARLRVSSLSRVDIDRPGVTYTIDTLRDIRAQHPDAELFFITGADAVAEIMQWKDADLMWDLAHFVAVTRPGYSSPDGVTLPEGKVDTLEIPALAISSTDVRRRAEHDEPVWYLVPDGVVQYIGKHGLYSYED